MTNDFQKLVSFLDVLEYEDSGTSIDEVMEKAIDIMKDSLKLANKDKGQGRWTWSVFSVKNRMIEQKAAGGEHVNQRKNIQSREALTGMIGRILSADSDHFLYEPDTTGLGRDRFNPVLHTTKSAIVSRINRNHDVVGIINIESDTESDFDQDSIEEIALYTGKIIALILMTENHKLYMKQYNSMTSRAFSFLEDHKPIPTLAPPLSFLKDITDLFCLDFSIEAAALFISLGNSEFYFATHTKFDRYTQELPEIGRKINGMNSLLAKSVSRHQLNPTSAEHVDLVSLIGQDFQPKENKHFNYARLYTFDVGSHPHNKYVLIAISINRFNLPDLTIAKPYIKLIESFTRSYFSLERQRLEQQQSILSGELYSLAFAADSYLSFLENAVEKLKYILAARDCYFLLARSTPIQDHQVHDELKLDSTIPSILVDRTFEIEEIIEKINEQYAVNDGDTISLKHCKINLSTHAPEVCVDIIIDSADYYADFYSDLKIILCLVDSNQYANDEFKTTFGVEINTSLLNVIGNIRKCMNYINSSRKNLDICKGLEIIQSKVRLLDTCNHFSDLVRILHELYGKTYQSGDEQSLSSGVQILNESYFVIYTLNPQDNCLQMSNISSQFAELPPRQPTFKYGQGLTGRVVTEPSRELFIPRVESTNETDKYCKTYWNSVLQTQFRYFYGKRIDFDDTIAVLTVIGKRPSYFQEQLFESTIKSLFRFLAESIELTSPKREIFAYPQYTKQILEDTGPKEKNVFLMIPYRADKKYASIRSAIRETLSSHGYNLLVADDHKYSDTLSENLTAYMDACRHGIAVIDTNTFNPNIAYEIGYLRKAGVKLLILKSNKVRIKYADLQSLLYDAVDFDSIDSVVASTEKWMNGLPHHIKRIN